MRGTGHILVIPVHQTIGVPSFVGQG
jgi:hypothetical protein